MPTLIFETETDVTLLGYANARQPDSDSRSNLGGRRDLACRRPRAPGRSSAGPATRASVPSSDAPRRSTPDHTTRSCKRRSTTSSTGPRAARRLGREAPRAVEKQGKAVSIARDAHGIALGGVRNPLVDVPVATLTGEPPSGTTNADVEKTEARASSSADHPLRPRRTREPLRHRRQLRRVFRASADKEVAAGTCSARTPTSSSPTPKPTAHSSAENSGLIAVMRRAPDRFGLQQLVPCGDEFGPGEPSHWYGNRARHRVHDDRGRPGGGVRGAGRPVGPRRHRRHRLGARVPGRRSHHRRRPGVPDGDVPPEPPGQGLQDRQPGRGVRRAAGHRVEARDRSRPRPGNSASAAGSGATTSRRPARRGRR